MRFPAAAVGAAAIITLAGCGSSTVAAPRPSPSPGYQPALAVRYCPPDTRADLMNVYQPVAGSPRPAPAVVYVHGGSWTSGSRTAAVEGYGGVTDALLARGFVVASLDYRLAPANKWPAMIVDVKCAVRSLRASATRYGISTNHIGAFGDSAGGHLVALLGLAGPTAGFDVGTNLGQSSAVSAVADLFGPADLTSPEWSAAGTLGLGQDVFGYQPGQSLDVLRLASPVTYVKAGAPPFLIIHGDQDVSVPLSQSQELYQRLLAAGGSATLVVVKNAGHEFAASGPLQPTLDELQQQLVGFFATHLGG